MKTLDLTWRPPARKTGIAAQPEPLAEARDERISLALVDGMALSAAVLLAFDAGRRRSPFAPLLWGLAGLGLVKGLADVEGGTS